MRRNWITAVLALCPSIISPATAAKAAPKPIVVIKYELDDKLILLPVSIGGRKAWFAFDSGAKHVVLDPRLANALHLRILGTSTTLGAGAGEVPLQHTQPLNVRLGRARVHADDPWIIDLSKVPIDKRVRGLLGPELLSQYVVRVDPQTRQMSLFDPVKFTYPGGSSIPLLVEGERLFVNATLDVKSGLSVTHKLRLDTGSGDSVNDPIVANAVTTHVTTLGNGLGQNYQGVSGRIDAVHLGPFTIRDVWAPGGAPASIGMEILRRFVVTFDAPHGKMFLKPTKALQEPVPPPPQ